MTTYTIVFEEIIQVGGIDQKRAIVDNGSYEQEIFCKPSEDPIEIYKSLYE